MTASMNLTALLSVGIGSSSGALARYLIGQTLKNISRDAFPWGTWVVNVAGTFLLGLLGHWFGGHRNPTDWSLILGTGFCGGFTTFSTMSAEAITLFRRQPLLGLVYLGSSLVFGFVLAWAAEWWL